MIEYRCEACGARHAVAEAHGGESVPCPQCEHVMQIPYPPLELPVEVTSGGSVVHCHEPGHRDWQPAMGNDRLVERITEHIETHLGSIDGVLHEIVSDLVHVDIHCIEPTEDRPFRSLITSGMSERPMSVPDDARDLRHLELMLCLPADWPMSQEALADENNYWPIRWLKRLARFPHEFDTWLFDGHTIPNGEPPANLADNNAFRGWIVMPPRLAPDLFCKLEEEGEPTIHFAAVYPLYEEELQLKLEFGTEVLFERLVQQGVTELIDVERPNVALGEYGALG